MIRRRPTAPRGIQRGDRGGDFAVTKTKDQSETGRSAGQRTRRGRCPREQKGEFPSVRGGQGPSKGRRGLAWGVGGVAGGLEQEAWGLWRVSKGLGGWGLEGAEGLRLLCFCFVPFESKAEYATK